MHVNPLKQQKMKPCADRMLWRDRREDTCRLQRYSAPTSAFAFIESHLARQNAHLSLVWLRVLSSMVSSATLESALERANSHE